MLLKDRIFLDHVILDIGLFKSIFKTKRVELYYDRQTLRSLFFIKDDKNIDKLAENTVVIAVNLADNNTIRSHANQNSGHSHSADYKSHPSDHNTGHPNITDYKTENNYHHLDPLSTQVSYPSNDGDHQSGSELNRNSSHISYSANDTRDGLAKVEFVKIQRIDFY